MPRREEQTAASRLATMVPGKQDEGEPMADEKNENNARTAGEGSVIDFNVEAVRLGDHIVRGTAADGQVRAFAVTARASVQELHEQIGRACVGKECRSRWSPYH